MKGIFFIMMLIGLVLMSGAVNAVAGTTPGTVCTMEMKYCANNVPAVRNADCSWQPCVNGSNINYKDKAMPCSAVPLEDKTKCCIDKGYTSYNAEGKFCVYNILNLTDKKEFEQKVTVTGLTNAILRVRNNETAAHLQLVMNKIIDKRKAKLAELENLTFKVDDNGTIVAEGKKTAKLFGFIEAKHKYYCTVVEDGTTLRNNKWWDIFFKDQYKDICGTTVTNSTTVPGTA